MGGNSTDNPYRDPESSFAIFLDYIDIDSIIAFIKKHAFSAIVLSATALSTALYFFPYMSFTTTVPSVSSSSSTISSSSPPTRNIYASATWPTKPENDHSLTTTTQASPSLAWFMSYPGSGTEYINYLVQDISQTTTATNYGYLSLPFLPDDQRRYGPFSHNDLPLPDRYLLTTTYCTGFCIECHPESMMFYDKDEFRDGCATGLLLGGSIGTTGSKASVRYDPDMVPKGVRLFRDPMENVVERFHDEWDMRQAKAAAESSSDGGVGGGGGWSYSRDEEGFRHWCADLDKIFATAEERWKDEKVTQVLEKMGGVPCHGLFFQLAQWHNNVGEVLGQYGHKWELLSIHYEDFDDSGHLDDTISQLFEFLGLPITKTQAPAFPPFRYPNYFTKSERLALSSFLKVVSSQPTWIGLRRYLPPPQQEYDFTPLGEVISPFHYGTWPEVVWLMSFPNSGTFFTTQFTQVRSRAAIATNYANEVGKNFAVIPHFGKTENGPFRYSMRPFSDTYILTKTHCVGHCLECSPELYVKTPAEFVKGCAKGGKTLDDGEIVKVFYDPAVARKAVHLVRNPMDNIVARFHFTYKEHKTHSDVGWTFSYDKEGFKSWCRYMDARYPSKEAQFFSEEILEAIKSVPCHGEFYQYVQWHNNALTVPSALNIPGTILYYEDFHYNIEEKMASLFDFLELPKVGKLTPFSWKGGYDDHYTDEERVAIRTFVKLLATEATWNLLERYFDADVARRFGWVDNNDQKQQEAKQAN